MFSAMFVMWTALGARELIEADRITFFLMVGIFGLFSWAYLRVMGRDGGGRSAPERVSPGWTPPENPLDPATTLISRPGARASSQGPREEVMPMVITAGCPVCRDRVPFDEV